jgi:hypothetical protein
LFAAFKVENSAKFKHRKILRTNNNLTIYMYETVPRYHR